MQPLLSPSKYEIWSENLFTWRQPKKFKFPAFLGQLANNEDAVPIRPFQASSNTDSWAAFSRRGIIFCICSVYIIQQTYFCFYSKTN